MRICPHDRGICIASCDPFIQCFRDHLERGPQPLTFSIPALTLSPGQNEGHVKVQHQEGEWPTEFQAPREHVMALFDMMNWAPPDWL